MLPSDHIHVLAARPVAGFARLALPQRVVHVLAETLHVGAMTASTLRVVDPVRAVHDGQVGPQDRERYFAKEVVRFRPTGAEPIIQAALAVRDETAGGGS